MVTMTARDATLGAVVREQATAFGEKPFLEFLDCTVSYAELDARTNSIANGFARSWSRRRGTTFA